MRRALLSIVLLGCGADDVEPPTSVSFRWDAAITCPERAAVGQRTSAFLKIGGHEDCELTVDQATLDASGTCHGITAGTVWPLMLVYSMTDGETPPTLTLPFAYRVGFANLCEGALEAGVNPTIDMGAAGSTQFIYQQSEVDALPEGDSDPSCDNGLAEAKKWARNRIKEDTLDFDNDGCANLVEACGGTLFSIDDCQE
jgi:hypothetical protein